MISKTAHKLHRAVKLQRAPMVTTTDAMVRITLLERFRPICYAYNDVIINITNEKRR